MEFGYTENQQMISQMVKDFAGDEYQAIKYPTSLVINLKNGTTDNGLKFDSDVLQAHAVYHFAHNHAHLA